MKRKLLSVSVGVFALLTATAQSNPTPFDLSSGNYSFTQWNATQTAATYPANMMFHRTGTSPNPTLAATASSDYTALYNLTSGARINGLGVDGFSFINTSSGDLGMAVVGLNASNRENITLAYIAGTVLQNTAVYAIRLQYRTSTSSTWLDVPGPVEYVSGADGTSQAFTGIVLPATCNNQAVVQVRWFYYFQSGSSTRPQMRIDDITIASDAITVPAIEVDLSSSVATGTEAAGTTITLTATAATAVSGDQTVTIAASGTNVNATDYSLSSTTITILDGATTGTATFQILDDNFNEGTETATITISGVSAGLSLGTTTSVDVAITDNDDAVNLTTLNTANTTITFNELQAAGTNLFDITKGFYIYEQGTNANTTYRAGNGNSSTGDSYSFGVDLSTERALGTITTGSLDPAEFGAKLVNTTGTALNALTIAYTGEQWRVSDAGDDTLLFYYSLDATALDNGTWTSVGQLNFEAPQTLNATAMEIDGNNVANQTSLMYQIAGLSIADNATVWIKWRDLNISGSDQGMAIDNLIITPQFILTPVLTASTTTLSGFNQLVGTPSTAQQFTVSGSNLTTDVTITASANYEVSLASGAGFGSSVMITPVSGTVASTPIFVRLNAATAATYTGTITIASTGVTSSIINLNGETTEPSVIPTLFINEFMASNVETIEDENSEYDDWFEIYNPSSTAIDLAGYYLTDDLTNLTKYQIPTTSTMATVPANGFLLIWADNQSAQGDLHTNFALSANGEDLVLVAPDGTSIVDQYTFGAQTADISEGRDGDGNATWVFFTTPTPNATNIDIVSLEELNNANDLVVYPNPSNGNSVINFSNTVNYSMIDMTGKEVLNATTATFVNVNALTNGVYFLNINSVKTIKVIVNN